MIRRTDLRPIFVYILNNTLINMLRTNTLDTFNAYNPVLLAKKSF